MNSFHPTSIRCIVGLIFVLISPLLEAEGLGRLFTSPDQRSQLERSRLKSLQKVETAPPVRQAIATPVVMVKEPIANELILINEPIKNEPIETYEMITEVEPSETTIEPITVNGLVRRANGHHSAWVNGINTDDGYFEPQQIRIQGVDRDHVHIAVDDPAIGEISLKVGQTLNPEAAEITDSYQEMLGDPNR